MIGTDWLRRKAAARKPATGGIVKATWSLSGETGCTLTIDNSESRYTVASEAHQPVAYIEFTGTAAVTDDQAQQIRDSIQIRSRPRAPEPWTERCPCVAIYSECRCTGPNISTQTKTADFHADQQ